ncbi:protein piccolo-like [Mizuhopecten yessoensis]|uniref:Translation initiation factor IF-2 n=1 Tax=Mizuhopecten yessoensis TaxID=6573 RepID=A0A210QQT0_MIZYE|nr:protein piccolo-like [Mizuhopecten yessoensis]OWF51068.1 Translation initiation factor IF-2 [Mizuhopecten yessoensis]
MADDRLVAIVLFAIAASVTCDVKVNDVSTIATGSENPPIVSGVPLQTDGMITSVTVQGKSMPYKETQQTGDDQKKTEQDTETQKSSPHMPVKQDLQEQNYLENKLEKQNSSESSREQQIMKKQNSAQPNTQQNLVQSVLQDQNLVPQIPQEQINPEQPIPKGQNPVQPIPPVKNHGLPIPQEQNPVQPITSGQNLVQPIPKEQNPVQPITSGQNPVQSIPKEQNPIQPITSGQNPVQPIPKEQNPVQPITSGQNPVQPITSGQNPVQPIPKEQNPVQPIPKEQNLVQIQQSGQTPSPVLPQQKNPMQINPSGQSPVQLTTQEMIPVQPNPPVQNPLQSSPQEQIPVQPNPPVQNPLQLSPQEQIPVQPNPPVQNPLQSSPQEQIPVQPNPPVQNPLQSSPQDQIPVQPNPPVQNPLQSSPQEQIPAHPVPQKQNPVQDISLIQKTIQPNQADLDGKNTRVTSSLQQEIETKDDTDQNQNFDYKGSKIFSHVTGVPQTDTAREIIHGILNEQKNTVSTENDKNDNKPTMYDKGFPPAQKHSDIDIHDVTQLQEWMETTTEYFTTSELVDNIKLTTTEYFTTSKQFRNDIDNVPVDNIKLTTARKPFLALQPGPVILTPAQSNRVPDPSEKLFVSDTTLALSSYTTTAWSTKEDDKDTLQAKDNFYEGLDLWDDADEDEFPTDDSQPLSADRDDDWNFFMGEKLIPKGKALGDSYRPSMESLGDEKGYPPPKEGLVTSSLHNKNEDINIKMDMIAYYSWILFITLLIFAIFIFARQRQKFGYILKWGQSRRNYGRPSDAEEGKNLMKNIYT